MAIDHDPELAEIRALGAMVPSFGGLRILEIGCGDGRLTRRYAATAAAVTAIDPDEQAIAECRAAIHDPHVTIYPVPFEQFSGPPATYDLVILSWSL